MFLNSIVESHYLKKKRVALTTHFKRKHTLITNGVSCFYFILPNVKIICFCRTTDKLRSCSKFFNNASAFEGICIFLNVNNDLMSVALNFFELEI